MSLRALLAAAALALTLSAGAAEDFTDGDPDFGTDIIAAAAFDHQLWVLGSKEDDVGAALVSFDLKTGARTVRFAGGIAQLIKAGGHLAILSVAGDTRKLLEWKNGAFVALPQPPALAYNPGSFLVMGDRLAVQTDKGVFVLEGRHWRKVLAFVPVNIYEWALLNSAQLRPVSAWARDVSAVPNGGGYVYDGENADPRNSAIYVTKAGDPSAGVARSSLRNENDTPTGTRIYYFDPVSALISDPGRADCVIAAAGVIHFLPSGRLLRVCEGKISLLYEAVTGPAPSQGEEAFFGLALAKDGFWALSNAALYRFGASGEPERTPLETPDEWHGLYLTYPVHGILVLYTGINRRNAASGFTPLLVPIDEGK